MSEKESEKKKNVFICRFFETLISPLRFRRFWSGAATSGRRRQNGIFHDARRRANAERSKFLPNLPICAPNTRRTHTLKCPPKENLPKIFATPLSKSFWTEFGILFMYLTSKSDIQTTFFVPFCGLLLFLVAFCLFSFFFHFTYPYIL